MQQTQASKVWTASTYAAFCKVIDDEYTQLLN